MNVLELFAGSRSIGNPAIKIRLLINKKNKFCI